MAQSGVIEIAATGGTVTYKKEGDTLTIDGDKYTEGGTEADAQKLYAQADAAGKLAEKIAESKTGAALMTSVDKSQLVADVMFKELDKNKDGVLAPDEIVMYLIGKGEPPSKVEELMSAIDTNADGKVTLEEWRTGWKAGVVGTSYKERMEAVDKIKSSTYAEGTLGHISQNPFGYTFADRIKAMGMVKDGKPLDTQTEFKYTPGAGVLKQPCCTIA